MPVALISQLLGLLPSVVSASADVLSLIAATKAALDSGAPPTDAQWAAVNAQLDALTARLEQDPAR